MYSISIFRKKCHKKQLVLFPILATMLIAFSCKKEQYAAQPAVVQVFNALDDGISLYTYLGDSRPELFRTSLEIRNQFYLLQNNLLYIHHSPQHIEFYTKPDTLQHDKPALTLDANLKAGSIFSLFIYGEKAAIEYSLVEDLIPKINRNTSSTHVRFANFSASQAISVNIKGQPVGSLIENISYKSLSDFVALDANKTVEGYEFEIRNQSTGALLYNYVTIAFQPPLNGGETQWINKSNTLVFTGEEGGANPNHLKITRMNHR